MLGMKCPHCGYNSNFTPRWHQDSEYESFTKFYRPEMAAYTCDHCDLPIVAILPDDPGEGIGQVWPKGAWGKDFPDVPEQLAAAASEAHVCLNGGSPRGAVALARSVVESVAKQKGIASGNLKSKIDGLYQQGHISEAMCEAAHEIRFAGNEAAHGDLVAEQASIADAEEIVGLMDSMLERIYQEPAKVARIREKRERRTQKRADAQSSEGTAALKVAGEDAG